MSGSVESREYWDKKFSGSALPWGFAPSEGAAALVRLMENERRTGARLLDLGCGYGRDSRLFVDHGHEVVGVDISPKGICKASGLVLQATFHAMDVRKLVFDHGSFDVVFANFLVHLFTEPADRACTVSEARRVLRAGGLAVFTVASTDDADCGRGEHVGHNTFRNERGVAKFYYADSDIESEFCGFDDVRVEPLVEHHVHDGPHTHVSRLVIARKHVENTA